MFSFFPQETHISSQNSLRPFPMFHDTIINKWNPLIIDSLLLKSYLQKEMLILRAFLIDFITFGTFLTPLLSSFGILYLLELYFISFRLFYSPLLSIFKIIASALFANCELKAPLLSSISYLLDCENIFKKSLTYHSDE